MFFEVNAFATIRSENEVLGQNWRTPDLTEVVGLIPTPNLSLPLAFFFWPESAPQIKIFFNLWGRFKLKKKAGGQIIVEGESNPTTSVKAQFKRNLFESAR